MARTMIVAIALALPPPGRMQGVLRRWRRRSPRLQFQRGAAERPTATGRRLTLSRNPLDRSDTRSPGASERSGKMSIVLTAG